MVTDAQFVKAWQMSSSPAEVCERLKLERKVVHYRAMILRKNGVPLKNFRVKHDYAGLSKLAESLAPPASR